MKIGKGGPKRKNGPCVCSRTFKLVPPPTICTHTRSPGADITYDHGRSPKYSEQLKLCCEQTDASAAAAVVLLSVWGGEGGGGKGTGEREQPGQISDGRIDANEVDGAAGQKRSSQLIFPIFLSAVPDRLVLFP